MGDADLYDWHDLRNSIVGLLSMYHEDGEFDSLVDKVKISDIPDVDDI